MKTDRLTNVRTPVILTVFAAGLILRIAAIAFHQRPLISDEREYHQLAVNLVQTREYVLNGLSTAYRPVGYPAFMSGIYHAAGPNPMQTESGSLRISLPVREDCWYGVFILIREQETNDLLLSMPQFPAPWWF
ncbi:MAG TPA: hypothetical protein VNN76_11665 [Bacteroidota bacterium]|nr:hypothetical protein [Bacteroidota bacterium]